MEQNLTKQFGPKITALFKEYLDGKIDALSLSHKVDAFKRPTESGKSLWWRFFPQDTLANTTGGLLRGLTTESRVNGEHYKESMQIAVDTNSIVVYYS